MEKLKVIERVYEPTEWVNSMVTIVKPNGKLRICIDPRDLNKAIKREHYPMKTIEELLHGCPMQQLSQYWMPARVFGKLNLMNPVQNSALLTHHLDGTSSIDSHLE